MTDPGTGATYTIYPQFQEVDNQPELIWMVIPGKAQWLKQFFDVQMVVTNLAPTAFTFNPGQATLNLPTGLSLATLDSNLTPQTLTQPVQAIPGDSSKTIDWLIRGDTEGYYGLDATYASTLAPVGAPVQFDAQTTGDPIHIWGATALSMNFTVDDEAYQGYPYHITAQITNVADVPVYNLSLALSPLESDTRNYIFAPAQAAPQVVSELDPGQTLTENYVVVPEFDGIFDQIQSFVSTMAGTTVADAGGSAIPWTINSQSAPDPSSYPSITATQESDGILVSWGAVAGAQGYQLFTTPNYQTDFPSTPAATVPATQTSDLLPLGSYGQIAVSTELVDGSGDAYNVLEHPLAIGPAITPSPPSEPAVTEMTGGVSLSWNPPSSTGGSPLTGYVVTPYVNDVAGTPVSTGSTSTSYTMTGLHNGTTYTFTVAAANSNGTGTASAQSTPITVGAPIAPTAVTATESVGQAVVSWKAPVSNGNKVTGYVVTPYVGGIAKTPVSSKKTKVTVTGLTNGVSYTFVVAAVAGSATGPGSAPSAPVVIGAPAAPKAPKAKVKSGSLTLTWKAPADGGSAITGYVVTPSIGGVTQTPIVFNSTATSEVISGLTHDTSYTFTVAAKNAITVGSPSPASTAVTAP